MIKFLFPICLFLTLLSSCKSDKQPPETSEASSKRILNEPEQTVLKFYKWYLKDIYLQKFIEGPDIKLTNDSVYYVDATEHIDFLNKSGYFSSKFYEGEIPMFKACDDKLKKVDPRQVDGNPADYVEGDDCAFFSFMIWTGGQGETLNTVDIIKSKITGDTALVVAVIGDSTGLKYSYPSVTLLNENKKWKISNIDISYHPPKN